MSRKQGGSFEYVSEEHNESGTVHHSGFAFGGLFGFVICARSPVFFLPPQPTYPTVTKRKDPGLTKNNNRVNDIFQTRTGDKLECN